jgi:alkylation response protein AidB-like acyl-CoA dehydrogenase
LSYDFEAYRASLSGDWFADDDLLQRLLSHFTPGADLSRLVGCGPIAAGRLQALAEESARPENAPALIHRDSYGNREDVVALPASTHEALAVAHGEARLGAVHGDPFVHYAMIYLLAQNGEAGVACSLACTDGLARSLEALGDGDVQRAALEQVRNSTAERYAHGAQFVTEIQGGSDVRANATRAVPGAAPGAPFWLHGQKWFCSNINADWFLVTARPDERGRVGGSVGLFLVPAYGESVTGGVRNGYRIERLKDKLGTRELATAEITLEGAEAWPVGPADAGLANLLRYVLVPSRFACVLFGAAALRRAERIVRAYTRFREAFGRPIADYAAVARTVAAISDARGRSLACAFELLRLWLQEADDDDAQAAVDFRVLLSLAKPAITRRATVLLHEAMMLLAGNGIEERFSPLPRLFRDSVIMETWEGPHNVLCAQALRDLRRFGVDPRAFVERAAGAGHTRLTGELTAAMSRGGTEHDHAAVALARVAPRLISAMGRRVLHDVMVEMPGPP